MSTQITMGSIIYFGHDELKRRATWFIVMGVLLALLGAVALSSAVLFTIASVIFFGSLMIVAGVLQVIHALMSKGWGGHFLDLVMGLLSTVFGVIVVANPAAAAVALTLLVASFLILGGGFRLAMAFAIPFQHVFWLALHGIINLMLGVLILSQWPVSGLWVIGLFIGIDMIFNGVTLTMLGIAAKRLPAQG